MPAATHTRDRSQVDGPGGRQARPAGALITNHEIRGLLRGRSSGTPGWVHAPHNLVPAWLEDLLPHVAQWGDRRVSAGRSLSVDVHATGEITPRYATANLLHAVELSDERQSGRDPRFVQALVIYRQSHGRLVILDTDSYTLHCEPSDTAG